MSEWVSVLQSFVLTTPQGQGFEYECFLFTLPMKIGFVSMNVWARELTLSFGDIDLNPSEVEMKIRNFILKDGGCIERAI